MNTELDLSNANALDESFSNFRLSSIKSKLEAQKKAKEEAKAKSIAAVKATARGWKRRRMAIKSVLRSARRTLIFAA